MDPPLQERIRIKQRPGTAVRAKRGRMDFLNPANLEDQFTFLEGIDAVNNENS